MDKKPILLMSILAVVLLVLGSLSTVVGYQSVQTSQQNIIKERINQRELLFQTICDIANNKEIQRIILKSHMVRGIFPTLEFPVVTKTQLGQMYFIGLILSKHICKSRIQSMLKQYHVHNPKMQKAVSCVIENDAALTEEITRLSNLQCDCDNENTTTWRFPVICTMLYFLYNFLVFLVDRFHQLYYSVFLVSCIWIIMALASYSLFNCNWYY